MPSREYLVGRISTVKKQLLDVERQISEAINVKNKLSEEWNAQQLLKYANKRNTLNELIPSKGLAERHYLELVHQGSLLRMALMVLNKQLSNIKDLPTVTVATSPVPQVNLEAARILLAIERLGEPGEPGDYFRSVGENDYEMLKVARSQASQKTLAYVAACLALENGRIAK